MSAPSPANAPNPLRDAAYYQQVHEQNPAYQQNNWLLDELETIAGFGAGSILELACGNGRFLELAAARFDRVYACDWAESPLLASVLASHPNVSFFRTDLYETLPPCRADLVVSADFLEHLSPDALTEVLRRIDRLAPAAFHKIACYDDGHSHLSVLPPEAWAALFQAIDPAYRLARVDVRYGDPARQVAVVVKERPRPRHFDLGKPIPGRDEVTRYFASRYGADSILDIGCGAGPVWPIFVEAGMRVTGVDLLPAALVPDEVAGHRVTYHEGDFTEKPIGRHGAVYSSHTIEHVPDTGQFLTRFFECVEPGGAFCLIWPPPKPAIVSGHVHVFNLGLMLYNLVRLGVDCRGTEMVRCGYCLAIMGRYRRFDVPALTHNEGDIDRLAPYFGCPVYQGFDGDAPPGVVSLPEACAAANSTSSTK